jgi:hypothetical protein
LCSIYLKPLKKCSYFTLIREGKVNNKKHLKFVAKEKKNYLKSFKTNFFTIKKKKKEA